MFGIAYHKVKQFKKFRERVEHINRIFDAVGLAAFTVMGTELAFTNGIAENPFLSITLGVLTGVGGGVLRDILTETTPYIFKKHIYAIASITGSALYFVLRLFFTGDAVIPSVTAILFIITIRLLAAKYRWGLPKIHLKTEEE